MNSIFSENSNCLSRNKINVLNHKLIYCEKCNQPIHKECYRSDYKLNKNEKFKNGILCSICLIQKINPFEKIEKVILEPQFIKSNDNENIIRISFKISAVILNNMKLDSNSNIYLYCYNQEKLNLILNDFEWPKTQFNLMINNSKINLINNPINITSIVKTDNEIKCEFEKMNKKFIICMILTKKIDLQEILLKHNLKNDQNFNKILNIMKNDLIGEEEITIKDVYSQGIIKIPVRGKNCFHLNCFDFYNFLRFNKVKMNFKCYYCKNICYVDELIEDLKIKNIISECQEKLKDELEDYKIIMRDDGSYYTKIKLKNKKQDEDRYFFNIDISKRIEKMNHSPKPKKVLKETLIYREEYQLEIFNKLIKGYEEITCKKSSNFEEDIINYFAKSKELKDFNVFYMKKLLLEINFLPRKNKQQVFPNNVSLNSTLLYEKACECFYNKNMKFFKFISLWSCQDYNLVDLIIETTKNKKGEYDNYFAFEVLLGVTYLIHNLKILDLEFEFIIGKMISTFCLRNNFDEFKIAHMIDLITILFPNFYLPICDFIDKNEKDNYYKIIVNFYSGIFSVFINDIVKIASIFKLVFQPISNPLKKLSEDEILFIQEFEEFLIYPLMKNLNLSKENKNLFFINWDINGIFREFLIKTNKNKYYEK